jgi:hypothetical protein
MKYRSVFYYGAFRGHELKLLAAIAGSARGGQAGESRADSIK